MSKSLRCVVGCLALLAGLIANASGEPQRQSLPPPEDPPKKALIPPFEIIPKPKEQIPHTIRRLKQPEDLRPKQLRLAVTPAKWDDMGKLLDALGEGFRYANISDWDLQSVEKLREFDVLFLTCRVFHEKDKRAAPAIRKFVEEGGTLYASDLRHRLVLEAFPEYAPTHNKPLKGSPQTVWAQVKDPGLKHYLEKDGLKLTFDKIDWKPATFDLDPKKTTPVLEGKYFGLDEKDRDKSRYARFLVRFQHKQGTVIFTSFHNEKQNNQIERKLLEYLVISSVNARIEAKLSDVMTAASFSKLDLHNQKLVPKETMPAQKHAHAKAGGLQAAVGFQFFGAKIRLVLTSPDGKKLEHEDSAPFIIEIPDAQPGAWQYRVTAADVPFANFPVVIGVGKTK